jgi:4-amino-4-deoxy-L-arabinose transferase-like glycosyltransferase
MRLLLVALAGLTVLRLALAASIPLAPDETYYYLWSTHLQAGYFDHPPLVALCIRFGTTIFGPTALGIRFMGPVLAASGSLLLWDAGERLRPGAGLMAAALLNATLLIGAGCIIITPDTPLMFCWTLSLWAVLRLLEHGNPRWWLVIGLACGAALLSKYTAALFMGAMFLWLLTSRQGRARLLTPWPWAAAVLAALVFAPDIWWNATHHWASFLKQGGRETRLNAGWAAENLAELLVTQFALATPVIFVLAGAGLWHLRRQGTEAARLLLWLTLAPGAVFLEHVVSERVQGNWVAVLYPAACLAAALLPPGRWFKPALAMGFVFTFLAYAQALWAPFPLPARMDPTALQLAGWQGFAQDAAAHHPAFLVSDDYSAAAELAYYAPAGIPVLGFDDRWNSFSWPRTDVTGQVGLMVERRPEAPCPGQIGTLTRSRGGAALITYRLCPFTAPAAGVVLPQPGADGH